MPALPDPLDGATGFEWNAGNSEKNWHTHAVTCAEAEEIFFNDPVVVGPDTEHSAEESRFILLGRTGAGRQLFVVFTIRGTLVRVVSARPMSRRERRIHEAIRKTQGNPEI